MNKDIKFKLILSNPNSVFNVVVHRDNEGTNEEKIGCLILVTDKKYKWEKLPIDGFLSEEMTVQEIIKMINQKNIVKNFSSDWVGTRTCFGLGVKSSDYNDFDWDVLIRFDEPIEMLE